MLLSVYVQLFLNGVIDNLATAMSLSVSIIDKSNKVSSSKTICLIFLNFKPKHALSITTIICTKNLH